VISPAFSLRRIVTPLALGALAAGLLAGCATGSTTPDDGRIRVVAVTDVYGDIAATIGGELVDVDSLISGAARDPHSFEASAQDRLAIADADVVIVNGGGYDDFMTTLLDATDGDRVVINAVGMSELPGAGGPGFNEHVWYDFDAVGRVASALADAFAADSPADAATFEVNLAAFDTELESLAAGAAEIATTADGAGALLSEPVPLYLLIACGLENRTPSAFSEAIEEGADVSPALLQDVIDLIEGGSVTLLAYNEQTAGAETQAVLDVADAAGVPVVSFTETLPDGEDYVSWMTANLDAIAAALS
jgi:zinc/manganese transport system substrate-binding protein